MDVRMPDGTVVRNVPDNITRAELMRRYDGRKAKQSVEEQRKSVADGMTLNVAGFDTGIEMPQGLTEFLAGAGKRLSEIGTLGTHQADPKTTELLDDSGYATAGGATADAATLLAGGSALKGAGIIKAAPSFLGNVGGGAAYGAATMNDRTSGALAGGIGGGIGHGLASGMGKIIAPKVTPGAQAIIDQGGTVTPGEILGGTVKAIEDKATSIPFVGDQISKAKRNSLAQWSKGVVNDAVKALGTGEKIGKATPAGSEAIKEAQNIISNRYDEILSGVQVTRDAAFDAQVASLKSMVQQLPKREAKLFNNILSREVDNYFDKTNGLLLGKTFKEVDSSLRQTYKKLLKSQDYGQAKVGDAVREVHASLLNMAKRQNKSLGKKLDKADVAYAKLSRIEDAASSTAAEDGIFTPAHLQGAIKKATSKKKFAAREGFDQQAVEAAKASLSSRVPDSGTTGRALLSAGVLGGSAVANPAIATGMMAGAGAYSQPGLKALQALLTKRPKGAKETRLLLEELAPIIGLGSTAGALNVE